MPFATCSRAAAAFLTDRTEDEHAADRVLRGHRRIRGVMYPDDVRRRISGLMTAAASMARQPPFTEPCTQTRSGRPRRCCGARLCRYSPELTLVWPCERSGASGVGREATGRNRREEETGDEREEREEEKERNGGLVRRGRATIAQRDSEQ
jgi:hypothetical protein